MTQLGITPRFKLIVQASLSLGVAVAGHYAYVADGSAGLQIVEVAGPAVRS